MSYYPISSHIRTPIQTQQLAKQETASGCHCKSTNDFERSARLYVQDGVSVHQSTISHSLHKDGLNGLVIRKKPWLKKMHLKARMEFVEKHLNHTAGMWRKVLWSDKTNIEHCCKKLQNLHYKKVLPPIPDLRDWILLQPLNLDLFMFFAGIPDKWPPSTITVFSLMFSVINKKSHLAKLFQRNS